MNLHNVKLLVSAGWAWQFPSGTLPEVVLLGRSNVGKSSLINCLLNRRNFARTSTVPGKTATVNFYEVDGAVVLVDLPGYGFARVPGEEEKMGRAD
jgi:GTP-binding protein